MAKLDKVAKKAVTDSKQDRMGPSAPKSQPRTMGKTPGQLKTSEVGRRIKGPDLGQG
jgi:hypothetical protein